MLCSLWKIIPRGGNTTSFDFLDRRPPDPECGGFLGGELAPGLAGAREVEPVALAAGASKAAAGR